MPIVGEICTLAFDTGSDAWAPLAQEGWLECNGDQLDQTKYSALYNALKDSWGRTENGKFFLPDLRGLFLRGWDHGRGMDPDAVTREGNQVEPGDKVGRYQDQNVLNHAHALSVNTVRVRTDEEHGVSVFVVAPNNGPRDRETEDFGAKETRPRNKSVMFAIWSGVAHFPVAGAPEADG